MKWILFILLLVHSQLKAQEDEKGWMASSMMGEIGIPAVGVYYLPAYKQINVYSLPNIKSKVFYKTQSFSDSLKVLAITNQNTVFKNVYGVWTKVSFPLRGKRFIGYVPSQFLCVLNINQGMVSYLVLVERYLNNKFILTLKILKNFQLMSNFSFESPANDGYSPIEKDTMNKAMSGFMDLTLFNHKGLDNIDNILRLRTGVEACGYWFGTKYFLLKNLKIVTEIEEGSTGDAGIYNYGYEHIFPLDNLGESGNIIKKMWNMEYFEDENYTDSWDALVKYKWQHNHLTKSDSTYTSKREKYLPE
jgi:hypothetical protein